MTFLQSLLALLRRGTPGFSILESEILDEAERQLGEERGGKLRSRVKSINLVQRLDGGREVNAYSMMGGEPVFQASQRIVDIGGEERLANFSFTSFEGRPYEGTLWLVDGQFFSIEFNDITEHILDLEPRDLKLSPCI